VNKFKLTIEKHLIVKQFISRISNCSCSIEDEFFSFINWWMVFSMLQVFLSESRDSLLNLHEWLRYWWRFKRARWVDEKLIYGFLDLWNSIWAMKKTSIGLFSFWHYTFTVIAWSTCQRKLGKYLIEIRKSSWRLKNANIRHEFHSSKVHIIVHCNTWKLMKNDETKLNTVSKPIIVKLSKLKSILKQKLVEIMT